MLLPDSPLALALAAAPSNPSVLQLVVDAGPVGKLVLFGLAVVSIVAWAIIFERYRTFRRANLETKAFLVKFHGGARLAELRDLAEKWKYSPVVSLFKAAFHEVSQLPVEPTGGMPTAVRALDEDAVEDVQRMMTRAAAANLRDIERSLTFLATTASASPFVGLFGTVWGIMDAFHRIGMSGSTSIQTYAPGIAEALIATATGLAAAVPAVVAYNSFLRQVRIMSIEMEEFQYDFIHLLQKRRRRAAVS